MDKGQRQVLHRRKEPLEWKWGQELGRPVLARQERVRHAWGKIQRASGLHSAELCATEVVEVLPKTLNGRWDICPTEKKCGLQCG